MRRPAELAAVSCVIASQLSPAVILSESKIKRSVFRHSAVKSGLITQEQMKAAFSTLRQSQDGKTAVDISDDALADHFIEQKLLTPYQAAKLKEGRTILKLGPYIITDWIAQGGMGQVFKAVHEVMGRESAVKVLPINKATDDAKKNFSREVRTQATLDHPNLVRAYDAGEDGKVSYLVVEYVPGTDLRRLVRTQKRLTMQQAASIIRQAALGLEHAHSQGLIHRDVKPGNILVTPDGIAKVSDLGLAGFVNETDDPRAGKVVGTADYLAPEQIRSPSDVDYRIDIYSLGCTLYYAITGKVPYPGGTASAKAIRHCEETPWHPRRFNPEISEEFVEVIADMMEKDPSARTSTMGEVAARLEIWADESANVPSQVLRSPWMPPPPPTGNEDEEGATNAHETGSGIYEFAEADAGILESSGQFGHATDTGAAESTGRIPLASASTPKPPRLPKIKPPALSPAAAVIGTLAVAAPLFTLLGAILGFAIAFMLLSR